jgi:hypothetical protein
MKNIILILMFFLSACSSAPPPGPDWRDGYKPTIDLSVGCPEYPVQQEHVKIDLIDPDVLRLIADPKRAGPFIGVIAAKSFYFTDYTTYIISGEFRKPDQYQNPEHISINLQYVDSNYIEHFAEIVWNLNPYNKDLYGKIWTRNVLDEQIILFDLADDSRWHSFEYLIYHGGNVHTIHSIKVDDHHIELDIPMGTVEKTYNNYFGILLEVQNMYTNCNPLTYTVGASDWRNVNINAEDY